MYVESGGRTGEGTRPRRKIWVDVRVLHNLNFRYFVLKRRTILHFTMFSGVGKWPKSEEKLRFGGSFFASESVPLQSKLCGEALAIVVQSGCRGFIFDGMCPVS